MTGSVSSAEERNAAVPCLNHPPLKAKSNIDLTSHGLILRECLNFGADKVCTAPGAVELGWWGKKFQLLAKYPFLCRDVKGG